jgi:hypothetical protein
MTTKELIERAEADYESAVACAKRNLSRSIELQQRNCKHPDGWVLDRSVSGMTPGTVVKFPLRCPHCGMVMP